MRRTVLALIGAAIVSATPASANPITIRIPVTAADLESAESVAVLYQRVEAAANEVCTEIMHGSLNPYPTRYSCVRDRVDAALEDTSLEPLAQYHEAMHSRRPESRTLAAR